MASMGPTMAAAVSIPSETLCLQAPVFVEAISVGSLDLSCIEVESIRFSRT
jgi:hypothetical protein